MPEDLNSRLSVSTYSLHRLIGSMYRDLPEDNGARSQQRPAGHMSLLETPAALARNGYRTFEISHPHLPSRDISYLDELRAAIAEAGVRLLSVLVEAGDLTDPVHGQRDRDWMADWIVTAGRLGAERARVIAGFAPRTDESFRRSREGLAALTQIGRDNGVRVTTENWFDFLAAPQTVLDLLDSLEGELGFNLDFGNWEGPEKYAALDRVFPRAETCHAKCAFPAEYVPDAEDFSRCLDLAERNGFAGPLTLIYDASGPDEWRGLEIERSLVTRVAADPTRRTAP